MSRDELDWKTRALAAEKTAAVLKARVRALDAGTETSPIARQLEQARRRSEENERKRALADLKSAELKRHNESLEAEVRARTAEIRAILDHVACGLLLVDRSGKVLPGSSRSCATLLSCDDVTGRNITDVLALSDDAPRGQFLLGLDQLFDDLLPEEVSAGQLQSRFVVGGRPLRVEASTVRDDAGVVQRALLTVTDVSQQEAAEREARRNRTLVEVLTHRDSFRLFVTDTHQLLAAAKVSLGDGDVTFARRALHTTKGNAAAFGLEDVVAAAHQAEARPLDQLGFDEVSAALDAFLSKHAALLALPTDETFQVTRPQLRTMQRAVDTRDVEAIKKVLDVVVLKPAGSFVGPIEASVQRLAQRLDKDVEFIVEGASIPVDIERLSSVFQSLPHLVRNAIDHGLETGDERGAKSGRPRVTLKFADAPDAWRISVGDDGRGIDTQRLVARAIAKGLLSEADAQQLSQTRKNELVFLNGLSTAEVVSEISGRGVGLSAVQAAAFRLGGRVTIETAPGHGTTFTIEIPKRRRAAKAA